MSAASQEKPKPTIEERMTKVRGEMKAAHPEEGVVKNRSDILRSLGQAATSARRASEALNDAAGAAERAKERGISPLNNAEEIIPPVTPIEGPEEIAERDAARMRNQKISSETNRSIARIDSELAGIAERLNHPMAAEERKQLINRQGALLKIREGLEHSLASLKKTRRLSDRT